MRQAAIDLKERLEYTTHEELIFIIGKLYRVALAAEREATNSGRALQEIIDLNDKYSDKYDEEYRRQFVPIHPKPTGIDRTVTVSPTTTRAAVKAIISVATKAVTRVSNRATTKTNTVAIMKATKKAATKATTRAITRAVSQATHKEDSDTAYGTAFDRFLKKELQPTSRELVYLGVNISQGIGWSLGAYDA
ncbi:MAG: hypothetical protein Q9180_000693 [Flavoplaca navasiana]